jgi:hypothetical protein
MVSVDRTELDQEVFAGDRTEPIDIVDRLLWRDAQAMLRRHAKPDPTQNCVWCGWRWPCAPRRLAERAEVAARRPWREALTLRHDLNSIRAMPGLCAGLDGPGAGRRAIRPSGSWRGSHQRRDAATNRGYFD